MCLANNKGTKSPRSTGPMHQDVHALESGPDADVSEIYFHQLEINTLGEDTDNTSTQALVQTDGQIYAVHKAIDMQDRYRRGRECHTARNLQTCVSILRSKPRRHSHRPKAIQHAHHRLRRTHGDAVRNMRTESHTSRNFRTEHIPRRQIGWTRHNRPTHLSHAETGDLELLH